MWSPQKPTWLSNVSPLSFIIPSVAPHSGRLALICDLFFSTSSRCLRLIFFIFMVYLSSHILPIVASYSLCSLSESSSLIAQTLDSIQNLFSICLFFSHTPPVPKLLFLFLCLVVFFMFASSSPSLFSSSLLINIWLWVHWHDTTVPCWSWGCSDLAAEDEEGNTQHFQTFIWALFIWSQTLSCSFQNSQSQTFMFLLCQNERGRGAQLQIQASIQQGF